MHHRSHSEDDAIELASQELHDILHKTHFKQDRKPQVPVEGQDDLPPAGSLKARCWQTQVNFPSAAHTHTHTQPLSHPQTATICLPIHTHTHTAPRHQLTHVRSLLLTPACSTPPGRSGSCTCRPSYPPMPPLVLSDSRRRNSETSPSSTFHNLNSHHQPATPERLRVITPRRPQQPDVIDGLEPNLFLRKRRHFALSNPCCCQTRPRCRGAALVDGAAQCEQRSGLTKDTCKKKIIIIIKC